MNHDDLTEAERKRLESLRASPTPPSELEASTLALLTERGLLEPASPWRRRIPLGWLVAATIVCFGLGYLLPRPTRPTPNATTAGTPYLLLLRNAGEVAALAPDEHRAVASEYGRWARALGASFVDGAELADDGLHIRTTDSGVTSLETTAAADAVAGYFLLRAADRAAVTRIAETCPHLDRGWIEVRRVVE